VVGAISSTTTVRVPVPIVDLDSLLLLEDGAIMALEGSDAGGFFRLEGTYTL
jgi:hypothetical protein